MLGLLNKSCIFASEIWTKKRSCAPIFGSKNNNNQYE